MSHFSSSSLAAIGRRLSARRIVGAAAVSAVAAGTFVALPAVAQATTTCAGQCVVNLEAQRGGLTMGVTFDTTVPATESLAVYRAGSLITTAAYSSPRTHHQLVTPQALAANTTYSWHLTVSDAYGNVIERTGDLTTLHRQVDVLFSTDTVTNDSDSNGSGEFTTWVAAGGNTALAGLMPKDIATGNIVSMSALIRKDDAGTATTVSTEMYDDDTPPCWDIESCLSSVPLPSPKATWNNGSSWRGDWATASGSINTRYATTSPQPFQIQVNANVGFVVRGTYSVRFVA